MKLKPNHNLLAHLAVLSANIIYGINYSVAKEVMPLYIQPFAFIFLRVVSAAILFSLAHALFVREKVEKQDYIPLAMCGLFGVAINQLLFFKGLSLTQPINAALMMTTNPVQVMLLAYIFLKERITNVKIFGITLGLIGAASIIITGKQISMNGSTMLGDTFIFLNSLSYAYFIIIAKPLLKKYHPVTVMKFAFLFGSIVVIPFGLNELSEVQWHVIPVEAWYKITFIILATTFIAYLLNTFALRRLPSGTVSMYIYTQPVFATLMSIYLGLGHPQPIHFIAATFIFVGVFLVSKPQAVK
ncbi:MAG TPA: DMT family transporter [Bacteroidia bacterium]|nr:DMT family transporter [Bacteroidia bacterium]